VGALGNLGTLLYNAGYRSAARLTYREALKHNPRDHRSLVNLGNALLESNELDESRQLYERAIELDANSAQAHQGLSQVLGRLGEMWGWLLRRNGNASRRARIRPQYESVDHTRRVFRRRARPHVAASVHVE
jgi:tetratricopeptide (TPR) repeat protein